MNQGIDLERAATPDGMRLYAIGDVHGRLDLLDRLLQAIDTEIATDMPGDWRIVTLGDYTDRGPDSRRVLDRLVARAADQRFVPLAGNHDDGFLAFLAGDRDLSVIFLNHGGFETAASYGVALDQQTAEGLARSRAELAEAVPAAHTEFLRNLATSAEYGDFFFCHAGIRPGVPLAEQTRRDLTWIRWEFLDHPHLHPRLVVHGHTPRGKPEILPNRIDIDTGAFDSGVLTAFAAEGGKKWLLQAHPGGVERMDIGD